MADDARSGKKSIGRQLANRDHETRQSARACSRPWLHNAHNAFSCNIWRGEKTHVVALHGRANTKVVRFLDFASERLTLPMRPLIIHRPAIISRIKETKLSICSMVNCSKGFAI